MLKRTSPLVKMLFVHLQPNRTEHLYSTLGGVCVKHFTCIMLVLLLQQFYKAVVPKALGPMGLQCVASRKLVMTGDDVITGHCWGQRHHAQW